MYSITDIASITWRGDSQNAAFRNDWDNRKANVKNQVPLWVRTEVLYKAPTKSEDLLLEMTYFHNKHAGDITAKNARRRYAKLMLILDTAITAEREG